ncbi:hypothetical protein FWG76_02925 [Candidatus Saccharibacteria bacterium]|nr:hypothetical protein [Candidatus Saccharibacteria bacterium]
MDTNKSSNKLLIVLIIILTPLVVGGWIWALFLQAPATPTDDAPTEPPSQGTGPDDNGNNEDATDPNLARARRDTQRKYDMDRVVAQTLQYMTNNQGQVPFTGPAANEDGAWTAFKNNYLDLPDNTFNDPNGEPYIMNYRGNATAAVGSGPLVFGNYNIYIYGAARCEGELAIPVENGARRVAFRYALEDGSVYCVDNS